MTSKEFEKEQLVINRHLQYGHMLILLFLTDQSKRTANEWYVWNENIEIFGSPNYFTSRNKSTLNSLVHSSETGRDSASFINVHYCKSNTNEYRCIVRVFSVLGNSAVVRQWRYFCFCFSKSIKRKRKDSLNGLAFYFGAQNSSLKI